MKKLWFNILIFFGCFLLFVTSLGAVLIIAPGMELLGIMYIRSTSGSVDIKESVPNATIYKTIQITADNIPVTVEFVQSYSLSVRLVESYNGFAKAGDTPTVVITNTDDDVIVKTAEYKPFLGLYSRSEESGLVVKVPMYYENDIIVNTGSSAVTFSGKNVTLNNINVKSNGAINFNNDMTMHSLELNFGAKNATIANSVNLNGNIVATSTRGDLTVPVGFTGSLNYTSKTGDLKVGNCGQLTFKSKTGQVKGLDGQLPVINGDAKIETNGNVVIEKITGAGMINTKVGKLTLGKEGGSYTNRFDIRTTLGKINMLGSYSNEESVISSKYGDININSIVNGVVSSEYGDITIQTANKTKLANKSGDIILNESLDGLVLETKSGDVIISSAEGAEYQITTKSGDITFAQKQGTESTLIITSKSGDVNLSEIAGETTITTNGKINANIKKVVKTITIIGKNKAVTITLNNSCYYDLTSNKKIEDAPDLREPAKQYNTVPESGADNTLKIETKRGKITVKLV